MHATLHTLVRGVGGTIVIAPGYAAAAWTLTPMPLLIALPSVASVEQFPTTDAPPPPDYNGARAGVQALAGICERGLL